MRFSKLREESGQTAVLVAVTILGLLAIAGLVIDGGVLFSARRGLQSLADGAARAGAMAIDEASLRQSGGASVILDPLIAEQAVADYLEANEFDGSFNTSADTRSVNVVLHAPHRTILVSLVGVREVEMKAGASAGPRAGGG